MTASEELLMYRTRYPNQWKVVQAWWSSQPCVVTGAQLVNYFLDPRAVGVDVEYMEAYPAAERWLRLLLRIGFLEKGKLDPSNEMRFFGVGGLSYEAQIKNPTHASPALYAYTKKQVSV